MSLDDVLAEIAKFRPKTGYNVVGVDDFAQVGDKLFLISNHPTLDEAEAVAAKHKNARVFGPV